MKSPSRYCVRARRCVLLLCAITVLSNTLRAQLITTNVHVSDPVLVAFPPGSQWMLLDAVDEPIEWDLLVPDQYGDTIYRVLNKSYTTVLSAPLCVLAGDILHIRAQVEMTCDVPKRPIRGHLRLLANSTIIGAETMQNNDGDGAHHMPLWSDGLYRATQGGMCRVECQYALSREGIDHAKLQVPVVLEGNGYGHLIVEHYRKRSALDPNQLATARVLSGVWRDTAENVSRFGGTWNQRSVVYNVAVSLASGDMIRLLGQSTSAWLPEHGRGRFAMHGAGIHVDGNRVSPWATENTPWAVQYVPLWTDAFYKAPTGRNYECSLTMHGVKNLGGGVVGYAGHLYVMRFSTEQQTPASDARYLVTAVSTNGPAADRRISVNQGWIPLIQQPLSVKSNDIVRITSYEISAKRF